ncbi:MAG TPA: MFS transporter [Oligoflexus sp.]|uniref:MFS transporter n=1 Tax=Oligoflexus sp. TaxID=1971216 RepID=UPI002D7F43E2|nr:MFS transporter [Oligoflexus sp.]HET9237760.1 MFS transporter [Oligoflexus sp.]
MKESVLNEPSFRLFLVYRLLVTLAIQMQSVAVAWQVYNLSHSALHLGYVGLAIFLPNLLFALPGGRAADRYPRRRTMLISISLILLTSASLLLSHLFPRNGLGQIYITLGLLGLARAYYGPAATAYLAQLVPTHQLPRAVAINSTAFQLSTIMGPALAGVIVALPDASVATVYATCLVFLLAAVLILLRLPMLPVPGGPGRDLDILGGLRYVWGNKLILGAISLDLFAVLLGGAVALLPVFARDILHVGAAGLGTMRSAPALGATLMAIYLSLRPLKGHVGHKMLGAVLLFGIATVGFGLSRNYHFSLACLVLLGATDMISVVVRQTLIQTHTPDVMRGRVSAVNMVFIGASNELGEFESGVTAAWLGTVPAVVLGGVGTCLVVLIWSLIFPTLRKVDKLHLGQ